MGKSIAWLICCFAAACASSLVTATNGSQAQSPMFSAAPAAATNAAPTNHSPASAAATVNNAVLVQFTSKQCAPCRAMQPLVAQLAAGGTAVRSVDVDREPDLARRYRISKTPTFVVISGGKEITRLVGAHSVDQLAAALATHPGGPLVPTAAVSQPAAPQTRLAPLPSSLVPAASPPSSEPMPSMETALAVERAQAATVRLRVYDDHGHGVGTGTVVDTHGEEALVLTCGHLFRDTQGQGRIEVDVFIEGRCETVPGQLIDYDADDRDIALVAIRPGYPMQPVPVIRGGQLPAVGATVFSFGCDRGADPSRRDTRITGVNKYNQHKQASNLEIAGAPIDGRSGGGLFTSDGYLIGVCNSADYQGDIGIYAGPGAVHWQLDRVQLSRLYQGGADSAVASNQLPTGQPLADVPPADRFASLDHTAAPAAAPPTAVSSAAAASAAAGPATSTAIGLGSDSELIVIIRDRNHPQEASRVVTLTNPSPELMQLLQAQ